MRIKQKISSIARKTIKNSPVLLVVTLCKSIGSAERGAVVGLVGGFVGFFLFSCSSIDCSVNSLVTSQMRFVDADGTKVALGDYSLTISTAMANGEDTLLNQLSGTATDFSLPVSYNREVDEYKMVFTVEGNVAARDTMWVTKSNEPVFESVDCSPRYNHTIKGIRTTHNLIDTITVNDNFISNDHTKVHFLIRLR